VNILFSGEDGTGNDTNTMGSNKMRKDDREKLGAVEFFQKYNVLHPGIGDEPE